MENNIIEAQYPITFRKKEAKELGQHLRNRHTVMLVGMKRVGISNLLRFFLYHKDIVPTYIGDGQKHLFIPVDLNDLVEREIFPFWILTFKRIVDATAKARVEERVKKHIESLFLDSIQAKDLFLTIDGMRKSLQLFLEAGVLPTIFFLRFDRMKDVVTPEFFANLQGLCDATHQKLAYVFTSYRTLDALAPSVFPKASLGGFVHDMYITPIAHDDTRTIYETYKQQTKLKLTQAGESALFSIVDGYVQYLQLALISLHEQNIAIPSESKLFVHLSKDERILLQSEELWESLTDEEKTVLKKVEKGQRVSDTQRKKARYVWDTGMVFASKDADGQDAVFSPLFADYVSQQIIEGEKTDGIDFSKKEYALFLFLKSHLDEICEREQIIEAVWPEVEALGVSDWAVDRLVARVRSKLKGKNSEYEIQTIKTRGYKLLTTKQL